jgi:hypothetical protein
MDDDHFVKMIDKIKANRMDEVKRGVTGPDRLINQQVVGVEKGGGDERTQKE